MIQTGPLVGNQTLGSIGTSAKQLTVTSQQLSRGLYIQCPSGNSGPLFIGNAGVTALTGFAVVAGGTSPLLSVTDPSTIYVISAGTGQSLNWIGF